ncbi:MAG: hypothetical protein ABL921_25530, partial [Pirellula sp.]
MQAKLFLVFASLVLHAICIHSLDASSNDFLNLQITKLGLAKKISLSELTAGVQSTVQLQVEYLLDEEFTDVASTSTCGCIRAKLDCKTL